MPGYRGHLAGAGITAVATLAYTNWHAPTSALLTPPNTWFLAAALFGGLFPDIDIKSKGQKLWYYALAPCMVIATWYRHTSLLAALGVLSVIPPLLPHRGITHEIWFIIVAPLGAPLLISTYHPAHTILAAKLYAYFVLGALSHIVLDFGIIRLIKRILGSNKKR